MAVPSKAVKHRTTSRSALIASVVALGAWRLIGGVSLCRGDEAPAAVDAAAEQRAARLAERDRLLAQATQFLSEGKHAETLKAAEQMLAIEIELFGEQHAEVAGSLDWVGGELKALDQLPAAVAAYERRIAILAALPDAPAWKVDHARRQLADARHLLSLTTQQRAELRRARALADSAHSSQGDGSPTAEEALREALAIRRNVLGDDHPDTAASLYDLGLLLKNSENYAAAKPLYDESLAIRRRVLHESDPYMAQSLNALGVLFEETKDYKSAQSYYEQALAIYIKAYGEQHQNTAGTLANLGGLLKTTGDFAAARTYQERALAIRRKILGDQHLDTAAAFNRLGAICHEMKDYATARPHYEEALAIRRQALGEEHADTAVSLANLGVLLLDTGQYAESCRYSEQALAVYRKLRGEEHPDTIDSMRVFGKALRKSGDYAAARPMLEQTLAIQRKVLGVEHVDAANTLGELGVLAHDSGDFATARDCYQQALAIRRDAFGEVHHLTAVSLENLGSFLTEIGEHAEARPLLEQALATYRKLHGESHETTAGALNSLGYLLDNMGDEVAARSYYEQSIAIYRKVLSPTDSKTAAPLNNLGGLMARAGQFKAARGNMEEALSIGIKAYGENHPEMAEAWNNLGWVCKAAGDRTEAKSCYERALAISRQVLGDDHPTTALALTNLGVLAMAADDYATATSYFQQALNIYRKTLGEDHPDLPKALKNVGCMEAASRQYDAAADLFWEAAETERRSLERQLTSLTDDKMQLMLRNLSPTFDILASLPIDSPAQRRAVAELLLSRKAIAFEVLNRRRQAEATAAANPQLAVERERLAAVQSELERLVTHPPTNSSQEELAERRRRLTGEIDDLEAGVSRQLARLLGDEFSLSVSLDAVNGALRPGSALVEFVQFRRLDFHSRQAAIPNYAAVVIAAGDAGDIAFIDLGPAAEIDALVEELSAQVREYQRAGRALGDEASYEQSYRDVAGKLYAKLLAPLETSLGGAKQICLGPDSRLHELPFEALVDASGKYLVEAGYQFAYVNSGRDLVRQRSEESGGGVYVFAGPNYDLGVDQRIAVSKRLRAVTPTALATDAPAGAALLASTTSAPISRSADTRMGWRHLPGADLEGQEAGAAFVDAGWGDVHTYTGDDALEDLVKTVRRPKALVLVTHGDFLEDQPALATDTGDARSFGDLNFERAFSDDRGGSGQARARLRATEDPMLRSYLLLAGANKIDEPLPEEAKLDNGWLTAQEISQLDLRGTDLVVLSACNTGRGRAENGQAVAGMRSAFLFAGARTIVGSLFEVPNAETRQLLRPFYEGVAAGRGKLASLNAAKLDFIRKRREETGAAHPFYWASFVLVGER